MQEQQPTTQPQESVPSTEREGERRLKTLAIRLDERLHAQLHFIAQLNGNSIADEIRRSIEARIVAAQDDPDLIARAESVRQQIEREAQARAAAITGFLGSSAVTAATEVPEAANATKKAAARGRSSASSNSQ